MESLNPLKESNMDKKTFFVSAVKSSISAFNTLDENTLLGLRNAAKLRTILKDLNLEASDSEITALLGTLTANLSVTVAPVTLGKIKRDIQPFLIASAISDSNGHTYGSSFFFLRGVTVRTPYTLDTSSSDFGESRTTVCDPENWETPDAASIDSVIDSIWSSMQSNPDCSLSKWFETYTAPLSFLFSGESI